MTVSKEPSVLDGSFGEGGGQMLRTALGLSAALGRPFAMINVRTKRRRPGLQTQHLLAVKALGELTDAVVEGAAIGSTRLLFKPRRKPKGRIEALAGTAASIALIAQPLIIAAYSHEGQISADLEGGTDVPMAPTVDYVTLVEQPTLKGIGVSFALEVKARGFYPRGGGRAFLVVDGWAGRPIEVGPRAHGVSLLKGTSVACSLPRHVIERQAEGARTALAKALGVDVIIELTQADCPSVGSSVTLAAEAIPWTLGSDALGERGKRAEMVGMEAASRLLTELSRPSSLDTHMSDMILPFLFLLGGRVTVPELTDHVLSNLYVCSALTGKDASRTQLEVEGRKLYQLSVSATG